jgi:hypothetical protein
MNRLWVCSLCLLSATAHPTANADNFASAHYDANTNELVVTLFYRGTNPDHTFRLQWGECKPLGDAGAGSQISADVLDDQWNDAALHNYKQTVRFSLADLRCRPAEVTLRTAPRFYYSLFIPAVAQPAARDASRGSDL